MSDDEFDRQAAAIAEQIPKLPDIDRIAAACRGSANPAALAWLAENLTLQTGTTVVDLGLGLGGPAAWFADRYGCDVVGLDPMEGAARGARDLFGLTVVRADSAGLPFRSDAFDVSLLLGVVSVVARPDAVLAEAARVSRRLGVLDYCSTRGSDLSVGGSHFPTPDALASAVEAAGWTLRQATSVSTPPPESWSHAADEIDVPVEPDEAEVGRAIEAGDLVPHLLVAER
jgi:ubiquinone/menaquinone biosynthesis C-methylase UbiE